MGKVFGSAEAQRCERWLGSPWGRLAMALESELVVSMIEPRPGERLLDIGCGLGGHLEQFRLRGLDVTGLDASAEMLAGAEKRLGRATPLHHGFAEHLPFDDCAFDVCTLITSLEFVADPAAALAEAARVARRRVVVGLLNPCSAHGLECLLRGLCGHGIYRGARFFSPWQIRRLIHRTLGPWPVQWRSALMLPPSLGRLAPNLERWLSFGPNPFGAFVAVRIDVACRYRVECEPLFTPPLRRIRQRLADLCGQAGRACCQAGRACCQDRPAEPLGAVQG
jgi:SAM-dependent methyltransferase